MSLKKVIGRAHPRHNENNGRGSDMSRDQDIGGDHSHDVNKGRGWD